MGIAKDIATPPTVVPSIEVAKVFGTSRFVADCGFGVRLARNVSEVFMRVVRNIYARWFLLAWLLSSDTKKKVVVGSKHLVTSTPFCLSILQAVEAGIKGRVSRF